MDGRKNNGGHSTKGRAGRKPKTEELQLIEKLKPLEPLAYDYNYYVGRPKETKDIHINEDVPLFID